LISSVIIRRARRSSPVEIVKKPVEITPGLRVALDFNCAESPLAWLRTRKDGSGRALISEAQYSAGIRLHGDFMAAKLMPSTTMLWQARSEEANVRGSRGDLLQQSEKVIAAKERYYAALSAVGPELSGILVEICCHATGIAAAERLLGLPRRSGKVVLQLALTRLARCYGLLAKAAFCQSGRIPEGAVYDISSVEPSQAPRRVMLRHGKR
jgi:uncharacterized protein DUF6456